MSSTKTIAKTAEADALAQVEKFRQLFEQAPGFIATTAGPEHRIEFANAGYRRLAGNRTRPGQLVGDAIPELAAQGYMAIRDKVFRTGKPFSGRARPVMLHYDDGRPSEERFLDYVYQPIREADGTITGVFFAGYDVTEQKIAGERIAVLQTELIHLSRLSAMATMATTLAHEINQPLTALTNYLSVAERELDKFSASGPIHRALTGAMESTYRAAELIRRIRDMARGGPLAKERMELSPLIQEAVGIALASIAEKQGVACRVDFLPGIFVDVDRVQIQQVVANLIRNAIEAMDGDAERELSIATEPGEDMAVVRVHDTGAGIAPEIKASLFEAFASSKATGMGMGLAICRTIIEAHGGKLWVEANAGAGTSFCFSLPRVD